MLFKVCSKCKEEKDIINFSVKRNTKDGFRYDCKECNKKYRKQNREREKIVGKQWRDRNKEKIRQNQKKYYSKHREKYILKNAKYRARTRILKFNISLEDITIPEICPVLGIKIEQSKVSGEACPNSPSLDRIDSTKGYVKGNVRVISHRANALKSDATVEELQAILEDIKKNL